MLHLQSAWTHNTLRFSMRPDLFGYPTGADWAQDEKNATLKNLREAFLANELPRYMEYFTNLIKEAGGNAFLLGEDLTIADIAAYQGITYFSRGVADYVPVDCLESYPEVLAFLKRVEEHPKVAAYKASKA